MKKKVLVLLVAMMVLVPVALTWAQAGPGWADNFDSYSSGTSLHGVGGWKGWGNNPAATASTSSTQAYSTPNSLDISGSADLVQELNVTGGLVHLRFWQYISSNLSGTSYFIMLNQYDDVGDTTNWSVQVQYEGEEGLMVDAGSSTAVPYIANQWVEVCLEIDLDADEQSFYYDGELFYSGSWSEWISGGGNTTIEALDLYAGDATSIYYDDISLNEGDCTTASPTPTPTTGAPTVTPGATSVDLTNFSGGRSSANLTPWVMAGVTAVFGLGWLVSRRRRV